MATLPGPGERDNHAQEAHEKRNQPWQPQVQPPSPPPPRGGIDFGGLGTSGRGGGPETTWLTKPLQRLKAVFRKK